jgi:hypothetical protein
MRNDKLTYGQLYNKLKTLGYRQQVVEVDGKRGQVFEHKTIHHAMIILPDRNPSDLVEPFDMGTVLATLKSRGLLPEINPLTLVGETTDDHG